MDRNTILNAIQTKINEMKETAITISEGDYIDFRGAGLNSVELMTLIVYLEEYFDFESDDEDLDLEKISLIVDLVDLVMRFA
jgi:acyl carrier protein